jgi:hypothetical protein
VLEVCKEDNIRIDNNRKKTMDFEREEEVPTTKDLK